MARRRCCGMIEQVPCCRRFLPVDQDNPATVKILFEEIEALRLKDIVGLEQVECAAAMGVSRATFQRILRSARSKAATALVEGHQIILEGGNYHMKNRVFECSDCGKRWEEPPCTAGGKHGYEIACPQCGGMKKSKIDEGGGKTACGGGEHESHGGGCCGGHDHS
ncbi:MAG: DUF134 domain-containing protein [Negativicutes bacterium]|nr:DUF134 domain-containing protein [Negativicutes bacterium]